MLRSLLTHRTGARRNAEHPAGNAHIKPNTAPSGRRDGGIAVTAMGNAPHSRAVNATQVTLPNHLRSAEQGSAVITLRRIEQGRSAGAVSRAERRGPQVNVSYPTGSSTADIALRAQRGRAQVSISCATGISTAYNALRADRGDATQREAHRPRPTQKETSAVAPALPPKAAAGGSVQHRVTHRQANAGSLSGHVGLPWAVHAVTPARRDPLLPVITPATVQPDGPPQHRQAFVAMPLQWTFPQGAAAPAAPSAGPRAIGIEDSPPPLPPKRRSRAVVSSRPARVAPSAAAQASATARFDKMMDWLGREGRRGAAYRLPADLQHRAVAPLVGQMFHAMDTQQVSVLYDALLALIDRWPPLLQPAVLRDLSEQAFSGLPEQRLAEHGQRWLNRLSNLAPTACDDLLEHIASHFAAVPADDGLAVFQRLVELSRSSSRPILSLLARQLEGLPAALRNLAQQILLGCPHLAADVRQALVAAQQAAAAAAESGASSVDSGVGSMAT